MIRRLLAGGTLVLMLGGAGPDESAEVHEQVKAFFEDATPYMVGDKPPDTPGAYCRTITEADPLAAHDDVAPYVRTAGVGVLECRYVDGGAKGYVILAQASAGQLARWVLDACNEAAPTGLKACARVVARDILHASGAQYPVVGWVRESAELCVPYKTSAGFTGFKHGVTVQFGKIGQPGVQDVYCYRDTDVPDVESQRRISLEAPVATVYKRGRIANAERTVADAPGWPGVAPSQWQTVVRDSYLAAFGKAEYSLLRLRAAALVTSRDAKPVKWRELPLSRRDKHGRPVL